jgi:hypothetical protein
MGRRSEPPQVTIRKLFTTINFLIFILITNGVWAQDASSGAIRGTVLDAQGAVVTNADIVAIRVNTGIRYHAATDSAGRFAVDLLPPGDYSARAEAEGMSPQISPTIRVDVGAATLLTFKLKVEGPKETVTVTDVPRSVEMNPSSVSALLDERHPGLAAERAAVRGSAAADARSDAGSAGLNLGVERGSFLWRNSWLQHELPGGWRR